MSSSPPDSVPQTIDTSSVMKDSQNWFAPLSMVGTWGRVAAVGARGWKVLLSINALASLVTYCLGWCAIQIVSIFFEGESYGSTRQISSFPALATVLSGTLVFMVVQCLADGASIQAVAELYSSPMSVPPSLMDCVQCAIKRVGALVTSFLLVVMVLTGIPFVLCQTIITLVYHHFGYDWVPVIVVYVLYVIAVMLFCFVAYPAVMVERCEGWRSVPRSMELTFPHKWTILALMITFWIARVIVNIAVSTLTQPSDSFVYSISAGNSIRFDFNMGGVGDGFFSILFGIVFATLGAILQGVVYFNLRVQEESYSEQALLRDLGRDPSIYTEMAQGEGPVVSSSGGACV